MATVAEESVWNGRRMKKKQSMLACAETRPIEININWTINSRTTIKSNDNWGRRAARFDLEMPNCTTYTNACQPIDLWSLSYFIERFFRAWNLLFDDKWPFFFFDRQQAIVENILLVFNRSNCVSQSASSGSFYNNHPDKGFCSHLEFRCEFFEEQNENKTHSLTSFHCWFFVVASCSLHSFSIKKLVRQCMRTTISALLSSCKHWFINSNAYDFNFTRSTMNMTCCYFPECFYFHVTS